MSNQVSHPVVTSFQDSTRNWEDNKSNLDTLETSIDTLEASIPDIPISFTIGTGTPEGVVPGEVGDFFIRTDGGVGATLYVKEVGSGDTGWAAK